jgi:hypothetical protein
MEYRLYAAEERRTPLATNVCEDQFQAQSWAREWARRNDKAVDYVLEREDGKCGATVFRTVAGQWYVMPR